MKVYAVNWSLNKAKDSPGYNKARSDLMKQFETYGDRISHACLENTMFICVDADQTAQSVYKHLFKGMDAKDNILISVIQNPITDYFARLDGSIVEWLKTRV